MDQMDTLMEEFDEIPEIDPEDLQLGVYHFQLIYCKCIVGYHGWNDMKKMSIIKDSAVTQQHLAMPTLWEKPCQPVITTS